VRATQVELSIWLNEFLKEHGEVQQLKATVMAQEKQIAT
jgi:hypothetical protein